MNDFKDFSEYLGICVNNPYRDMKIEPAKVIIEEPKSDKRFDIWWRIWRVLRVILYTVIYLGVLVLWVIFAMWFHVHVSEYMVMVAPFVAVLITAVYLNVIES